jgi:hypothetical protein
MSFDPFTAGFDLIKTGLDKFFPDANEELKGKLDQAAAQIANEYALTLGQLKINEAEAQNPSFFVAGARPAVMWVGVITLLYSGIGISFLSWLGAIFGWPPFPLVDPTTSNNILMGLLGLGGMRTVEKIKGVATNGIFKK